MKFDPSICRHCNIRMSVGTNGYETEDGGYDVEHFYYCDNCGAEYS